MLPEQQPVEKPPPPHTHADCAMAASGIRCRTTWHFQGRGLFWEGKSYTSIPDTQVHIPSLYSFKDRTS